MKPCKAKLPDGKPCPNQVDEGQEYCPFHLANQDTKTKNILSIAITVLGVAIVAIVKFVTSSKRE